MSTTRILTIALAATLTGVPSLSAQDEIYPAYAPINYYRVYLSPARHTDAGSRGECNGQNENTMAYWVAWDATNADYYNDVPNTTSDGRNLTTRGYEVRIGTGTLQSAINNSNAWGADLHIPLHSNAGSGTCSSTNPAGFGTNIIYRSGSANGQSLANALIGSIGPVSPGTHDYTCLNPGDPCTAIDLGELRDTYAIAAYIESEFHTWTIGVDWLWSDYTWRWRIGVGVDQFLGYP